MRSFTFDITTSDVMDSRDLIERIEELQDIRDVHAEDETDMDEDERQELEDLEAIAKECEGHGDWKYGEAIIPRDAFVDYISQLIDECYDLTDAKKANDWPYRHMEMDYEAAAQEAEQDYMRFTVRGHEFLMRA